MFLPMIMVSFSVTLHIRGWVRADTHIKYIKRSPFDGNRYKSCHVLLSVWF